MAFDHEVFPLAVARFSPSIEFQTTIVVMDSGHEQRNACWEDARLKFDAAGAVQSTTDLATLIRFFRARKGAARAFPVKDWSDYRATNEAQIASHPGAAGTFQLKKTYSDAYNSDVPFVLSSLDELPLSDDLSILSMSLEAFDSISLV